MCESPGRGFSGETRRSAVGALALCTRSARTLVGPSLVRLPVGRRAVMVVRSRARMISRAAGSGKAVRLCAGDAPCVRVSGAF
ncbi:hypothetical protein GCM10009540_60460 [Streptomyces turgidiscabies]